VDKLLVVGRWLFALSMVGLGVEHFIFGEFVTGRAPPWPFSAEAGRAWAYVSGAAVILSAVAIAAGWHARLAGLFLCALIFGWALLRHLPVVAASAVLAPEWTRAVKALAFCGGALVVAASFPAFRQGGSSFVTRLFNAREGFVIAGTICLAVFMVNNGIQHFLYTGFVASLIPAWFPGDAVFWTYAASVFLFCGAIGMLYRPVAGIAALLTGMMVFAWVWIVHVPRVHVGVSDQIAVFEAPAIAGIAFMIAGLRFGRSP
jgi:hypothetical protein